MYYKFIGIFFLNLNFFAAPTIVLLNSVPTDLESSKKTRFPTVLSFSYDMSAYHLALLSLLRRFKWRSISVIDDDLSRNPFSVKTKEMCRATMALLRRLSPQIDLLHIHTDSTTELWNRSLQNASDHSRSKHIPQSIKWPTIAPPPENIKYQLGLLTLCDIANDVIRLQ
jgi:hypothetical protein